MSGFVFGEKSQKILSTCHPDLITVFNRVITITPVDFSVIWGHRSPADQFKLYKKGRQEVNGEWKIIDQKQIVTYIDGYKIIGKHNFAPSKAADIMVYNSENPSLAWDLRHLSYIAGIVHAVSVQLFETGQIAHRIRWGGNWDGDKIIIDDQKLIDGPHFEIIEI